MKRSLIILAFVLLFCVDAAPQSFLDDLETVRQIELLKANQFEVAGILGNGAPKFYPTPQFNSFSLKVSHVRVEYSSGKCSEEPASPYMSRDDWDIGKSKVTGIEISPWDDVELKVLGTGFTKFRRERLYRGHKNLYILYNKDVGMAIEIHGTLIKRVYLFPSRKNVPFLCKNESIRKFYLSNKWRRYPEEKHSVVDLNYPANVTDLQIARVEDEEKRFQVEVTAKDPENDVLTYSYDVSGGKILGVGAKVIWDLSSAGPGTYKITAGVDDGSGICGRIMSKVVTIK